MKNISVVFSRECLKKLMGERYNEKSFDNLCFSWSSFLLYSNLSKNYYKEEAKKL